MLQLLITDMMLRSTPEQKDQFKRNFRSLPDNMGTEQAIMTIATSRTTTDHVLFLVMSFMEENNLTRTFGFSPPPPPKPTGKRKSLDE
jgi:hypothetical protein